MLHAVGEIDELHTLLAALWRPVWEEEEERAVSCHMLSHVHVCFLADSIVRPHL